MRDDHLSHRLLDRLADYSNESLLNELRRIANAVGAYDEALALNRTKLTLTAPQVASLYGTTGLQLRMSSFLEEEAEEADPVPVPGLPITPNFVLSSPLDGVSVTAPAVTVNGDTAGARGAAIDALTSARAKR